MNPAEIPLNGPMVLNGIQWYSMVFNGIQWYLNGIFCKGSRGAPRHKANERTYVQAYTVNVSVNIYDARDNYLNHFML